MRQFCGWTSLAVAFAVAGVAVGQENPDPRWRVTISPYVWAKFMEGKLQGAGLSSPIHVPFSEAFEKVEGVFMGEVSVDGARWGGYVDYQGTDSRDERRVMGLPLEADIRLRSLTGAVYYVAHDEELGGRTVHGAPRLFRIRPLAGARWSRARADLAVPGLIEVGKQAEWTDIIVGVRTDADLNPRWKLTGHLDVGGFDPGDRFSLNAHALSHGATDTTGAAARGLCSALSGVRAGRFHRRPLRLEHDGTRADGRGFDHVLNSEGQVMMKVRGVKAMVGIAARMAAAGMT